MVSLDDYLGREQSYVKHVFLEHYLERLVHKTASTFDHIVYIDGFAGPWQSLNEQLLDTSFGIALNSLRRAKESWRATRQVQMSAFLVERNAAAYNRLTEVRDRFPDISIHTYLEDFETILPTILSKIPGKAFAFFFIDPKGWRIRLRNLTPMLTRPRSEVIFNFMFEFINRAANIRDHKIATGLDELIPYGNWREKLDRAEDRNPSGLSPDQRKAILVSAFSESLKIIGNYNYAAETTIFRSLKDRPLYCLVYATRHPIGLEVYRDCQVAALQEQSKTRAAAKVKHSEEVSGQSEIFASLHEMGPNELSSFLNSEADAAKNSILELTPWEPQSIRYDEIWPQVLGRHIVKLTALNAIAAKLRKDKLVHFPDWQKGKRVPQGNYRMQRLRPASA